MRKILLITLALNIVMSLYANKFDLFFIEPFDKSVNLPVSENIISNLNVLFNKYPIPDNIVIEKRINKYNKNLDYIYKLNYSGVIISYYYISDEIIYKLYSIEILNTDKYKLNSGIKIGSLKQDIIDILGGGIDKESLIRYKYKDELSYMIFKFDNSSVLKSVTIYTGLE